MSYALNEYVCPNGHITKNIQYDEAIFCKQCFREWQEKQFPVKDNRTPLERTP